MIARETHLSAVVAIAASFLTSCNWGPPRIKQPEISPSGAGAAAITQYDKNGDGVISGDELNASPALKAALPRLDTNKDGGVSADEIAERVNAWKAMQSGMTGVHMRFTLDGQPLVGAKIVIEPEAFLGSEVKPASGVTTQFGEVSLSIAKEDMPDPTLPGGAHFGLYKVLVSKVVSGGETILARYNSQTVLGQEVSYDDPGMKRNNISFALKSNTK